jgi:hypothetical protein
MAGLQILPPGTLEENPSLLLWRGGILHHYTVESPKVWKTAYFNALAQLQVCWAR